MDYIILASFQILVLLYSVTIHELSHGLAANSMGDDTARSLGRLTLNPLKHLDLFGSIILPFLLALTGLPAFGYAKPVPYNPLNLSDRKWGPAKVALAGPLSNIILAVLFSILARLSAGLLSSELAVSLFSLIVYMNIVLAVFNLFPIPPLDGHWILFSLLPARFNELKTLLYSWSMPLFIVFIFFGLPLVQKISTSIFYLLVGFYPF